MSADPTADGGSNRGLRSFRCSGGRSERSRSTGGYAPWRAVLEDGLSIWPVTEAAGRRNAGQ